jgi:hypothetical protein
MNGLALRDGMIVGKSSGLTYNDFLRSRKHYANFELRFSFRLLNGSGNSGVQFRSKTSFELLLMESLVRRRWISSTLNTGASPREMITSPGLRPALSSVRCSKCAAVSAGAIGNKKAEIAKSVASLSLTGFHRLVAR